MQNDIFKRINSGYKHFKSLFKKTIVPISKHVEWCRWLYGGSGYRMLLFAVIIAILCPVLISILGYCVAVDANDLLGNHNKDIGNSQGIAVNDTVAIKALLSKAGHSGNCLLVVQDDTIVIKTNSNEGINFYLFKILKNSLPVRNFSSESGYLRTFRMNTT